LQSTANEPRPAFAFAGIWRRYSGPVKKDGPNVGLEVFAFLTTTPNTLVSKINHERMPVILTREEQFETWLNGSTDEAMALSRQYPPGQMRIVRAGWRNRTSFALRRTQASFVSPSVFQFRQLWTF